MRHRETPLDSDNPIGYAVGSNRYCSCFWWRTGCLTQSRVYATESAGRWFPTVRTNETESPGNTTGHRSPSPPSPHRNRPRVWSSIPTRDNWCAGPSPTLVHPQINGSPHASSKVRARRRSSRSGAFEGIPTYRGAQSANGRSVLRTQSDKPSDPAEISAATHAETAPTSMAAPNHTAEVCPCSAKSHSLDCRTARGDSRRTCERSTCQSSHRRNGIADRGTVWQFCCFTANGVHLWS